MATGQDATQKMDFTVDTKAAEIAVLQERAIQNLKDFLTVLVRQYAYTDSQIATVKTTLVNEVNGFVAANVRVTDKFIG